MDSEMEVFLPPEIERFVISEDSMKDILGKKLEAEIRSLDTNGEKIQISLPDSFLNKVVEESYGEKTDSVKIEDGEVEVKLSDSSEIPEGEENGEEPFDI
ncbi:hypothetical protein AKJ39_00345 [candidate division MSBL1 archaeon SCGC-AAA259J03]|uniref:Uncharacterized protein n=1 Tax=candidate division MSBL1 archaeon SCGC-AAA259J03 TaxID=1698269 RepID=A0A656Z156_9EURY|nr:hypothetical protein AKJ39_00345 [candidate division MSBL1 archaeon SCGC-AAA259J03]